MDPEQEWIGEALDEESEGVEIADRVGFVAIPLVLVGFVKPVTAAGTELRVRLLGLGFA